MFAQSGLARSKTAKSYCFCETANTIKASTICSSLGELMVTPFDSDVTWRSDGNF